MSTEEPSQPPAPAPPPPDNKLRLECEKLKAEIEATRRPILRTPSFYTAMSPIILAILGLLWSWLSGWFDVQRTRISNEKTLLEAQTEGLKAERITLERKADEQRAYVGGIENELTRLKLDRASLSNQVARLERERDEMRSAKEFFASEAQRLAGSETNALRLFTELQAAQTERINLSDMVKSLLATNAELAVYSSNQTEFIIRAHSLASSVSRTIVSDKALSTKLNPLFKESLRLMLDATAYLPWWRVDADPGKFSLKTYEEYMEDARARLGTSNHQELIDTTNRLRRQLKVLGDTNGL